MIADLLETSMTSHVKQSHDKVHRLMGRGAAGLRAVRPRRLLSYE
jgi:hypothetical protein